MRVHGIEVNAADYQWDFFLHELRMYRDVVTKRSVLLPMVRCNIDDQWRCQPPRDVQL